MAAKYVLVVIAVVFFAAGFAAGILVKTYLITAKGAIVIITPPQLKLRIYADEILNNTLTEIDWGPLNPGDSETYPAWIENRGDVPFNMTLSTQNWNPAEAEMYITVSWNYTNQTVSPGEVLPVTFTLEVSSGISEGSFSFDIVITATEA